MARRGLIWVVATLVAGALSGSACHRRRPRNGTCVVHIDCDPGYDCVSRRCTKRPLLPGTAAPEAPIIVPAPGETAPPPSAPAPEGTPPPAHPRPGADPAAPIDNTPPPPPDQPAWKARLKII
jgi:hypothetical protein